MADRPAYEPVLSSKAAAFIVGHSRARQRKLVALLFQLADNPFQIGDYSEPDQSGREVQFILVRDLLITFWADHAIRELRIVNLEEV